VKSKKKPAKNYWIIRYNIRQSMEDPVVEIVRGQGVAENAAESHERKLSKEERDAGWSYIYQETTCKPRTDLKTANELYRNQKAEILDKFRR
jgi:hypothetical protein